MTAPAYVLFTQLNGTPLEINPSEVVQESLAPVPAAELAAFPGPPAAGTYIRMVSGERYGVSGTLAATRTAITTGSPSGARGALKFSGQLTTAVGAVAVDFTDSVSAAGADSIPNAPGLGYPWPTADGFLDSLTVNPALNTSAVPTTVTVYKNGAPTTLTAVIPPGSTALVRVAPPLPVGVKATPSPDLIELVVSNPGEAGFPLKFSAQCMVGTIVP